MVNTLSGSVCAYRKETVKPRFIRIDEVTQELQPISGYCQIKRPVQSEKVKYS